MKQWKHPVYSRRSEFASFFTCFSLLVHIHPRIASILVTCATLLLTAGVAWYAAVTARENDRARFENAVQHTRDAIEERVNVHLALLRSTAALFTAEDEPPNDAFKLMVGQWKLEQNYPGLTAIAYAERVDHADRESFLKRMREDYGPSFVIRPAGERSVYYPVVDVEPALSMNIPAIAADLFAEPVRHRAMSRARDIGKAATSMKVTLMLIHCANTRNGSMCPGCLGRSCSKALLPSTPHPVADGFIGLARLVC